MVEDAKLISGTLRFPRLIDNLMTDALALGSQMEKKSIDAEVILAAVSNQKLM